MAFGTRTPFGPVPASTNLTDTVVLLAMAYGLPSRSNDAWDSRVNRAPAAPAARNRSTARASGVPIRSRTSTAAGPGVARG